MKISILQNKFFKVLFAIIFWVVIWYILSYLINKEVFLPYPHTVLKRFSEIVVTPQFLITVLSSLIRILLGFLVGTVFGFGLAFLTHYSSWAEAFVSPAIKVVRATPVVSFILLAYLWLNNDTIPVFIALLMVTPIVWQNTSAGLLSLDGGLLEMSKVFKLKKYKIFTKIIMPQLGPHLYSGSMSALGLAWKSGIAAEVISYPQIAIGKEMNEAKVLLETADVLVWSVSVIVLSMLFELLFKTIFKKKLKQCSSKVVKQVG